MAYFPPAFGFRLGATAPQKPIAPLTFGNGQPDTITKPALPDLVPAPAPTIVPARPVLPDFVPGPPPPAVNPLVQPNPGDAPDPATPAIPDGETFPACMYFA